MSQSLIMTPAQSFLHLAKHPAVALITGAILLASGIEEVLEAFLGELSPFGLEHGAVAFGLFTCLRAFADLVEGTEWLEKDCGGGGTAELAAGPDPLGTSPGTACG